MKALAQMILTGLSIPVLTFGRSTWITVVKKKSILFAAWMIPSSRKFGIGPGVLNRQIASMLRKNSSQGSMPYSWAAPLGSCLHSSSMGLNTLKGKSQVGILRILAVQLKKKKNKLTCIFSTLGEMTSKAVHTQLQWLCNWGLSDKEENQYDTHWGPDCTSEAGCLVPNFERREVRDSVALQGSVKIRNS